MICFVHEYPSCCCCYRWHKVRICNKIIGLTPKLKLNLMHLYVIGFVKYRKITQNPECWKLITLVPWVASSWLHFSSSSTPSRKISHVQLFPNQQTTHGRAVQNNNNNKSLSHIARSPATPLAGHIIYPLAHVWKTARNVEGSKQG